MLFNIAYLDTHTQKERERGREQTHTAGKRQTHIEGCMQIESETYRRGACTHTERHTSAQVERGRDTLRLTTNERWTLIYHFLCFQSLSLVWRVFTSITLQFKVVHVLQITNLDTHRQREREGERGKVHDGLHVK